MSMRCWYIPIYTNYHSYNNLYYYLARTKMFKNMYKCVLNKVLDYVQFIN